jgi:hypothetical protein
MLQLKATSSLLLLSVSKNRLVAMFATTVKLINLDYALFMRIVILNCHAGEFRITNGLMIQSALKPDRQ